MPTTEDDLRRLLRDRTADVPMSTSRLAGVQHRVEARKRRDRAVTAGVLAVVLVAGALFAVPRLRGEDAVPPADTSKTLVYQGVVGGLAVRTEGPAAVDGDTPFEVELSVTNSGSQAWRGVVAVGALYPALAPGWYDGGLFDVDYESGSGVVGGFASFFGDQEFAGGGPQDRQTIPAGATRTWTLTFYRSQAEPVTGDVRAWVAYADPDGDVPNSVGDATDYPLLAVSPQQATMPCGAVTISNYTVGDDTPYQLDYVLTAVVGADREAEWTTEAEAIGTPATLDSNVAARPTVVAAAIAEAGGPAARGYGYGPPQTEAELDPGRYVAYSGFRTKPVLFSGTCDGSGDPVSGTWNTYSGNAEGLLDCSLTPAAGTAMGKLAVEAKAYCPKG